MLVPALLFAGPDAEAGSVHGIVRPGQAVGRDAAHPNAYPGRANSLARPDDATRGRLADAVIYVETIPDSLAPATPQSEPQLVQENQSYRPRVVAVTAGGSVSFPNRDPIYHNVFSLSPTRRFDLGKYPRGQTKHVRFERTGVVKVYCDIHSNMEAFILVVPNGFYTRPNDRGEFRLPSLPAGRYTVVAWHPDFGEVRTAVDVTAEDLQIELGF
jgi:plastocyanin